MAEASKVLKPVHKVILPHMIHDRLEWITSRPQAAPNTRLSVKIDTQSYRDQNIRPPSAFKHRNADIVALADTGCQAVCIESQHLSQLGLSKCDLVEVQMKL